MSPTPSVKRSAFVDSLESTRAIPRGAQLSLLASTLKKKIRLRSDVRGEVFPANSLTENSHSAVRIPAGHVLLATDVSGADFSHLRDVLPPGKVLLTLFLDAELLRSLSLCGAFKRVALQALQNGADAKNISENARVIDKDALEEIQDGTAIVVFALSPEEKQLAARAQTAGAKISAECLATRDYE